MMRTADNAIQYRPALAKEEQAWVTLKMKTEDNTEKKVKAKARQSNFKHGSNQTKTGSTTPKRVVKRKATNRNIAVLATS